MMVKSRFTGRKFLTPEMSVSSGPTSLKRSVRRLESEEKPLKIVPVSEGWAVVPVGAEVIIVRRVISRTLVLLLAEWHCQQRRV